MAVSFGSTASRAESAYACAGKSVYVKEFKAGLTVKSLDISTQVVRQGFELFSCPISSKALNFVVQVWSK
jgi:hypothetical protein